MNGRWGPGRTNCTPFDDVRGVGYALTAPASYAGLLSGKLFVKDGGGGQPIQPSLVSLFHFEIQGVAVAA